LTEFQVRRQVQDMSFFSENHNQSLPQIELMDDSNEVKLCDVEEPLVQYQQSFSP
jgi:hypothetical protein